MHKYPFVRLLIPLIVGIVAGEHFVTRLGEEEKFLTGILLFFCSIFVVARITFYPGRWIYGCLIQLFLFSMGFFLYFLEYKNTFYLWSDKKEVYSVILSEEPVEKKNSVLCQGMVHLQHGISEKRKIPVKRKVLFYLPKDDNTFGMKIGDRFLVHAKIEQPANSNLPEAFDYARYLFHQSVSGISFIRPTEWILEEKNHRYQTKRILSQFRANLLDIYRNNGFSGDEFAVAAALSLGFKEEVSPTLKEAYAASGGSHVLALSGLHIHIFCIFFSFLLSFLNQAGKGRMIKRGLLLFLLGLFACIAGLTPSIVRAVIMFSLVTFAPICENRKVSLNILAATAFMMLVYQPFILFNVSFQLSYSAVSAILLISPLLNARFQTEHRIKKYAINLVIISLSAQLGTLPFTLYYFSHFPVFFLFTNLVILLPVTCVLYCSVLFILATPFTVIQSAIASFMIWLLCFINASVRFIQQLPFASIGGFTLSAGESFLLYLILTLSLIYLYGRRKFFIPTLLFCCIFTGWQLYSRKDPVNPGIIFYEARNNPVIHLIENRSRSYLIAEDPRTALEKLSFPARGYWNTLGLSSPQPIGLGNGSNDLPIREEFIHFRGKTLCYLGNDKWAAYISPVKLKVDYLYITKGYTRMLTDLYSVFTIGTVVLDASLPEYRIEELKEACRIAGINFLCLREKGYLRIPV